MFILKIYLIFGIAFVLAKILFACGLSEFSVGIIIVLLIIISFITVGFKEQEPKDTYSLAFRKGLTLILSMFCGMLVGGIFSSLDILCVIPAAVGFYFSFCFFSKLFKI